MVIRVLLADDSILIRAGLAMLLSAQPGMEVVGEADDGVQAVQMARELKPDIVVMDLKMPNLDGIGATREITADEFEHPVKVLVLTTLSGDEDVYAALRAGASGFLLKDGAPTDLAAAIREVCAGNAYLHPAVTRGVIADIASRSGPARAVSGILDRLTPREREVLEHMALGMQNQEIAERLFLSEATVKTHVCRILMKLEVKDRGQAIVAAYQNHLVAPGRTV
ncbi:response regulator [Paractinoplanes rishiriensis]|uniref:DNA-binding response regulator n=1 Tax=Paractinoplanes rishiriensis TaxID=1050105 RepID=A0A919MSL3_9ACTN|nr:response regulator transcription factor [Actinoplanes rishiriensis]GIE93324.1 DNA-binding response regulator [Actinoplanes rishiriensis]